MLCNLLQTSEKFCQPPTAGIVARTGMNSGTSYGGDYLCGIDKAAHTALVTQCSHGGGLLVVFQ